MSEIRSEYKYYVPREIYSKILNDILIFCRSDEYSDLSGYYDVSSVYFDSMGMKCYFDRLDGNNRKMKFRLRSYHQNSLTRFFVEMKHKIGDKNFKNKMEINKKTASFIFNGGRIEKKYGNDTQFDYFKNILTINNLYPFLKINYKRKAFFDRHRKDIRLTFDYDIHCCRFKNSADIPRIPVLSPEYLILEIKSERQLPWWLLVLIKKYNLQKQSISKYLLAVQSVSINSSFCLK